MRTSRGRPDLETGQRLFTEYMLYTTLYVQAIHQVRKAIQANDRQRAAGLASLDYAERKKEINQASRAKKVSKAVPCRGQGSIVPLI